MGSISVFTLRDTKDLSLTYKGISPVRRIVLRQSETSEPNGVKKKLGCAAETGSVGLFVTGVLNPSKEDVFIAISLRDGDRPYKNAARLIEKMMVAQAAPRPGEDWIKLFLVSQCRSIPVPSSSIGQ